VLDEKYSMPKHSEEEGTQQSTDPVPNTSTASVTYKNYEARISFILRKLGSRLMMKLDVLRIPATWRVYVFPRCIS